LGFLELCLLLCKKIEKAEKTKKLYEPSRKLKKAEKPNKERKGQISEKSQSGKKRLPKAKDATKVKGNENINASDREL